MIGEDHFFVTTDDAINYLDHGAKYRDKQMLNQALQNNVFREGGV